MRPEPLQDASTCWQLYADDLVILADSPADLQAVLSAILRLAHLLAFHFRYWPWSSGRLEVVRLVSFIWMVCILASFSYHVSVGELTSPIFVPVATVCSISPAHGVTVKAYQSVSSTVSVFIACVLSSPSFSLEYIGDDPAALLQFNLSLRRWCRQVLGWPRASPVAAVHWEHCIGEALRLVYGRALSLFGRLSAMVQNGHRSRACQYFPALFQRARHVGPLVQFRPFVLSRSRTLAISVSLHARLRPLSLGGSPAKSAPGGPWPYTSMAYDVRVDLATSTIISHLPSTIPFTHGASLSRSWVLLVEP